MAYMFCSDVPYFYSPNDYISLKGHIGNKYCRLVIPKTEIALCVLPEDILEVSGTLKSSVLYADKVISHTTPCFKKRGDETALLSAVPMSIKYFGLKDPSAKTGTVKRYTKAMAWLEKWLGANPGYIKECLDSISDGLDDAAAEAFDINITELDSAIFSRKACLSIPMAVYKSFLRRAKQDSRFCMFRSVYDMPWDYVAAYVLYLYTVAEVREASNQLTAGGITENVRHAYLSNFSMLSRTILYNHPSFIECLYRKSLNSDNPDIEFSEGDIKAIEIARLAEKAETEAVVCTAKAIGWRQNTKPSQASPESIVSENATLAELFKTPALQKDIYGLRHTYTMAGYYCEDRLKALLDYSNLGFRYCYSDSDIIEDEMTAGFCIASSHRHKKRLEAILTGRNIKVMGAAEFINTEAASNKYILAQAGLFPKNLLLETLEKIKESDGKAVLYADPYSLIENPVLAAKFPPINKNTAVKCHIAA